MDKVNTKNIVIDKAIFSVYSSSNYDDIFQNAYKQKDIEAFFNEAKKIRLGFKLVMTVNMDYTPENLLELFTQISNLSNYLNEHKVRGMDLDVVIFDTAKGTLQKEHYKTSIDYRYYNYMSGLMGSQDYSSPLKVVNNYFPVSESKDEFIKSDFYKKMKQDYEKKDSFFSNYL